MRRLPTVLTDEELAGLYRQVNESTATGKRDRALLQVMADAGLRISEALSLRPVDLRREQGRVTALSVRGGKGDKDRTVYVTPQLSDKLLRWLDARAALSVRGGKGDKDRTVYVTPQLSDKLLRWLDARAALGVNGRKPVFCRIKAGAGETLTSRTVQELVTRLAKAAEIDQRVSPHTLRHTCATRTLRAGGNLRIVQELLGHARLSTTEIYTHVSSAERQAAAESLPTVD